MHENERARKAHFFLFHARLTTTSRRPWTIGLERAGGYVIVIVIVMVVSIVVVVADVVGAVFPLVESPARLLPDSYYGVRHPTGSPPATHDEDQQSSDGGIKPSGVATTRAVRHFTSHPGRWTSMPTLRWTIAISRYYSHGTISRQGVRRAMF